MDSPSQTPVGKTSIGWPGTLPEISTSYPIATLSKPVDDEDEWDYEYSTTETEVRIRCDWQRAMPHDAYTAFDRHIT